MKNQNLLKRFTKFGILSISVYNEIRRYKKVPEPLRLQFIRAATSVGANFAESQGADSKKDFINKLNLSFKELYETQYWTKIFISIQNSPKLQSFLSEID